MSVLSPVHRLPNVAVARAARRTAVLRRMTLSFRMRQFAVSKFDKLAVCDKAREFISFVVSMCCVDRLTKDAASKNSSSKRLPAAQSDFDNSLQLVRLAAAMIRDTADIAASSCRLIQRRS
ncbi:hypothetical protein LQG66_29580 [Bradyrhizobium ontarionense]|uniref:Uncharacterized protein n=1 Tax=Bradyrhizobium ontarionense TaxID=2898149 RepID=A0ABY3R8W1_9BRAD|nr:hypothetical protein [Bradyrhizobium sp. A19]UFZ03345.1 hypothetical protein LQG66_29580 [Bradyrhizobium sp. A19]